MEYRTEHDTMGEVQVPSSSHWGAQTQRSKDNFRIGGQRQPLEIIRAFAYLYELVQCVRARFTKFCTVFNDWLQFFFFRQCFRYDIKFLYVKFFVSS